MVFRAALDDARIAVLMLERKWPAEWGRKQTMSVEGNADKPIALKVEQVKAEMEAQLMTAYEAKVARMSTEEIRALRAAPPDVKRRSYLNQDSTGASDLARATSRL